MWNRTGLIFVISGPSGSGKTTLAKRLLAKKEFERSFVKSVSYTTRRRRSGEKQGRDYFFIGKKEFFLRRSRKEFLEWTKYLDAYYATSAAFIEEQLRQQKNIIFSPDIKGAFNIKKLFPQNTVLIFILPPSLEVLKKRLKSRSSEALRDFRRRIKVAQEEIKQAKKYDYRIINADLKTSVEKLASIVRRRLLQSPL